MQLRRHATGQLLSINTASPLGKGGEAHVYSVLSQPELAAKIYADDRATWERAAKLAVMCAHPPTLPNKSDDHTPIAWPIDLLTAPDDSEEIVGFIMPRARDAYEIINFYNPQTRLENCPLFDYRYLLRTARNLAAAVRALHTRGYVIGDLKHSNVLVTETALVTLVDTDSFQVRDPETGRLYPCPVRTPDFTPPELQGRAPAGEELKPEHDLFGLAVMIFHLLMEGTHPFAGVYLGEEDPPPFEERIAAGHFPYGAHPGPYRPSSRQSPPFALLPPRLQELFLQTFDTGHSMPFARPDAKTWQIALDETNQSLAACSENAHHFYSGHLDQCPWCLRRDTQLRGLDPFPAVVPLQMPQAIGSRTDTWHKPSEASPVSVAPVGGTNSVSVPKKSGMKNWPAGLAALVTGLVLLANYTAPPMYHSRQTVDYFPLPTVTTPVPQATASPNDCAVAISADGKTIAGGSKNITVWDAQTGKKKRVMKESNPPRVLALSANGKILVSAQWEGEIKIWNTHTGEELSTLQGENYGCIALSPDGSKVALAAKDGAYIELRNIQSKGNEFDVVNLSGNRGIFSLGFSTNGKKIGVLKGTNDNTANTVSIYDAASTSLINTMATNYASWHLDFLAQQDAVLISGTVSEIWHFGADNVQEFPNTGISGIVASAPDQMLEAQVDGDGLLHVVDINSGETRFMLPSSASGLTMSAQLLQNTQTAFSRDGKYLITGSAEKGIRMWNAETGALVRAFSTATK